MKLTTRLAAAAASVSLLGAAAAVVPAAMASEQAPAQASVQGIGDDVTFVELGDTVNTFEEMLEVSKKRVVILSIGRNNCGGCENTKARMKKWSAEEKGVWLGAELNKDLAPITAAKFLKEIYMVPTLQAYGGGGRMMQPFPLVGPTESDLRHFIDTAKAKFKPKP